MRLRRRRRTFTFDRQAHAARLHAADMWLREARVFADEIAAWPTPLACWLALLAEGEPVTTQGSDVLRGPDARWRIVDDQLVFGGGPYGRPGRRGAPGDGPRPHTLYGKAMFLTRDAGTGDPVHDEALRRARGF